MKAKWVEEHQDWQKRSLQNRRYVYIWADGIDFNIRADARQCLLVMIGVTDNGNKDLLGLTAGYRESELIWKPLWLHLKDQGLKDDPELAIGDGAFGFWKALPQVFPTTKNQRCCASNLNWRSTDPIYSRFAHFGTAFQNCYGRIELTTFNRTLGHWFLKA